MRKIIAVLLALLLLGLLCTGVFALSDTPLVMDEAGVLSDAEREALRSAAEELSETLECDVAAALVGHIADEDEDGCAKRYYNEHDYGYGPDYDGVLLLADTTDGDMWIAACGLGGTAYTDDAYYYCFDCVQNALGDADDWNAAVKTFLSVTEEVVLQAKSGEPFTQSDTLTRDASILTIGEGDALSYTDKPLVVDEAGLLSDSELSSLRTMAEEITERQECAVVIAIVPSLEGKSSMDYADDYYDYRGYGYGPGDDGMLLLIPAAERDAWISTFGFGAIALTDYGIDYVFDCIVDALGDDDDWYAACRAYLQTCDSLLTQAREGDPLDNYYGDIDDDIRVPQKSFGEKVKGQLRPGVIILSLVIGFVLALIPIAIHSSKVKNVKWQKNATSYLREGSMRLDLRRDQFMFVNTTTRHIETERSSGGHGGGSSMHISSSGRSHGGGGRHL